jgi:hypothetical protein
MKIIRVKGEAARLVLSKADKERIEQIDEDRFLRDAEFPKDIKIAEWIEYPEPPGFFSRLWSWLTHFLKRNKM